MKVLILFIGIGLVLAKNLDDLKLSPIQASYQSLTDCQLNICKQLYHLEGLNSDAEKLKFVACQSGCNVNVIDGVTQCDVKCESMYQDDERLQERDACKQSCKTFGVKKNEEISTLDRPSRPFINGKRPLMEIKVLDSNGNWVNPNELDTKEEHEQVYVDGVLNVLDSILNRGEPSTMDIPKEESNDAGLINNQLSQLHMFYNSIFDKMKDLMHSKMDTNDGENAGFYYYAQILSNGTVIESIKKPFSKLFGGGGDDDVDRQVHLMEQQQQEHHLNHRLHGDIRCAPISFNWKTMCHDTNNFFNCLSLRYRLPKWFFLSSTLVSSFLMIWMGLYILTMIRRIGRHERTVYRDVDSVDSLPLYKDLKFEEKKPLNGALLVQEDQEQSKQKFEQA